MDSKPRQRKLVIAGSLLLAASAAGIGAGGTMAPAVAALLSAELIRRGLACAGTRAALPPLEVPVGVAHDCAGLAARALALESQLEFAPVALFRIGDADGAPLEAVNAGARRLLAPGRATDPAQLRQTLAAIAPGQRGIIDFDTERGTERAIATAGAMAVEGSGQRLFALTPVEAELEAEAMQAWQKLVHVLTHEIMNSLTPVASLSQTSRDLVSGAACSLPADVAQDLDLALDAISRRAESLAHFVSGYRNLASVPEAVAQPVALHALFARMAALVGPAWQARGGRAIFSVEPGSLELMADPGQLEQALFNLLKNAAEATAGQASPEVHVSARLAHGGRLRIEVSDNGPGVRDDALAHIFTPFFSTRNSGGGIGLAMVRQLVHRNGGAVRYAKSVRPGARFIITF